MKNGYDKIYLASLILVMLSGCSSNTNSHLVLSGFGPPGEKLEVYVNGEKVLTDSIIGPDSQEYYLSSQAADIFLRKDQENIIKLRSNRFYPGFAPIYGIDHTDSLCIEYGGFSEYTELITIEPDIICCDELGRHFLVNLDCHFYSDLLN